VAVFLPNCLYRAENTSYSNIPEDGGSKLLRNGDVSLQNYMLPQPRRPQCKQSVPQPLQMLYLLCTCLSSLPLLTEPR
jgi:hypothetical protein